MVQVHVHLDDAVGIILAVLEGQLDPVGVEFIAALGQRALRGGLGPRHLDAVARLLVVAARAVDHQEPVEAIGLTIAGKAARDAAPVAAIGQRRAAADGRLDVLLPAEDQRDGAKEGAKRGLGFL